MMAVTALSSTVNATSVRCVLDLRAYQQRIVNTVVQDGNTIVMLPTGSGKTLIAAEAIKQIGTPALFLVPTCLLVTQQAAAIRSWTGLKVQEFMGGMTFPSSFEVLVSTPKAFSVQQAKARPSLEWSSFKVVVFDEVHHVLKEHPYRKIALQLKATSSPPRILGLSASLTYAVGEKQVNGAITRICAELQISKMETASTDEMRSNGYHASHVAPDLKPVDVEVFIPEGVVPEAERKPHLMIPTFLRRLQERTSTVTALAMHDCINAMEKTISDSDQTFRSPLDINAQAKTWGAYAHGRSLRCPRSAVLEHWYESLRILLVSWEEAEDTAIAFLKMNGMSSPQNHLWPSEVQSTISRFWESAPTTFPRFENLKRVLISEDDGRRASASPFRGLLFVQQRVMTHVLEYLIRTDPDLSRRFKSGCLYASSSPATPSLSVSASVARSRLTAFAEGEVNLLITTVVAEEGMDVPAANCVIRFDPMLTSVSFAQGRGRARQENSSFIVLSERQDRNVAMLAGVEEQQLRIVRDFVPAPAAASQESATAAQRNRELGARPALASIELTLVNARAALNIYCKKTKVELTEVVQLEGGRFVCNLGYVSILRNVQSRGGGTSQKASLRAAALAMVADLLRETAGCGS